MCQLEAMKDSCNDLHNKLGYTFHGFIIELQKEINKVIDKILGGYEKFMGQRFLDLYKKKRLKIK